MQQETWQQLLSFESRDLVSMWFKKIHGRELNARRAKEITAAAAQSREFFRNSNSSANSVKPLLTFYGVASLARALTLLLRRDGGEEGLSKGHGLETVDWSNQLSGELSVGIAALYGLKIRTCSGLFSDFAEHTQSRIPIHVNSSAVDWRLKYPRVDIGDEFSFGEITRRMPDLRKEHEILGEKLLYSDINDMNYEPNKGINIKVQAKTFKNFQDEYYSMGYSFQEAGNIIIIDSNSDLTNENIPQFLHSYLHKTFGTIPNLFLVAPMPNGKRYSQLCMMYIIAFVLGMLVRYFPTHWVSLSQGNKGDALWPTINRAHRCIEESFPEMVAEMVEDILSNPL